MRQPGYQVGAERGLWWKVAKHLDEARVAAVNAMAHNLDDPTRVIVLQDQLRDAQATLLEIFREKGLLPRGMNGAVEVPLPGVPLPTTVGAVPVVEALVAEEPAAVDVMAAQASADQEAAAYEAAVEDPAPLEVVATPGGASSADLSRDT